MSDPMNVRVMRVKAEAVRREMGSAWFGTAGIATFSQVMARAQLAYIAAASPDFVLRLLDVVESAERLDACVYGPQELIARKELHERLKALRECEGGVDE